MPDPAPVARQTGTSVTSFLPAVFIATTSEHPRRRCGVGAALPHMNAKALLNLILNRVPITMAR